MSSPEDLERLGLSLVLMARRYRKEMDAIFAGEELSEATSLPLRFLVREDRILRQKDLAELLDIEGPTLVRVLDTLVARGFVRRTEDPDDRRAKLVSVTHAGRAYLASLGEVLTALRTELFAGIPEDDVAATLRLLGQLEANIAARRKDG
ncbi:MarR family winged helix-turn-helix transcriptional regulator [Rhodobacter lacus]|uniref:MarR family winged helix-turn-helix transcriptional regulator n=1 Tax=Rhodobacter lacus TaxID=1641972 RepID=A0ABW5A4K1_9RHOB